MRRRVWKTAVHKRHVSCPCFFFFFFFFQNTVNGGPCIVTSAPVSPQHLLISGFLFCGLNAFAVLVLCRRSTVQPRDPARGERALPQTAGPQHRQIQNGLLWCKCTIKYTVFVVFGHHCMIYSPPIQSKAVLSEYSVAETTLWVCVLALIKLKIYLLYGSYF